MKDTDVTTRWMESIENRLDSINTTQTVSFETLLTKIEDIAKTVPSEGDYTQLKKDVGELKTFKVRILAIWGATVTIFTVIGGLLYYIGDKAWDYWIKK